MDNLSKSLNVQYGITNDYWKAKRITMFSKQDIRMYAVHREGTPETHVANEYWYIGKATGKYAHPSFKFLYWEAKDPLPEVIAQDTLHVSRIISLQDSNYSLFITEPFTYKNLGYDLHN